MAKNNKGKVIQMLSPENYIRQKARTLPIHECWLNTEWQEEGMANIVVTRRHTNSNFTVGLYLIDINCLGVKDTNFYFNMSPVDYRELIDDILGRLDSVKVEYPLVHNIIFAGLEYAEDYGFKPHKDFALTKYILEEDTDDVELIEIECGNEGKPLYIQGPYDSDARAMHIIAQLEKTAGPGNFDFIRALDGDEYGEDNYDDEEEPDQFENLTLQDKRSLFANYYSKFDQLEENEADYFFQLNDSIIDDLVDTDEYNKYSDAFFDELKEIVVDDSVIPDEMLGVEPDSPLLPTNVKEMFLDLIQSVKDLDKMRRQLVRFRKNKGVEAAADYIDLLIAAKEDDEKYGTMLEKAAKKYPCYGLVQLQWARERIDMDEFELSATIPFRYDYFFKGRDFINSWEHFDYLYLCTSLIAAEENLDKLEAWKDTLLRLYIEEVDVTLLLSLITMFRVPMVAGSLKIV